MTTDALTGLPNRRAWDERIEQAVAEQHELTIAMLDPDHFKQFNEPYGYRAGDRLLKETSAVAVRRPASHRSRSSPAPTARSATPSAPDATAPVSV
jgi:diguanylate cyclase